MHKAPSIERGIRLPCLEEHEHCFLPRFLSEEAADPVHRAKGDRHPNTFLLGNGVSGTRWIHHGLPFNGLNGARIFTLNKVSSTTKASSPLS